MMKFSEYIKLRKYQILISTMIITLAFYLGSISSSIFNYRKIDTVINFETNKNKDNIVPIEENLDDEKISNPKNTQDPKDSNDKKKEFKSISIDELKQMYEVKKKTNAKLDDILQEWKFLSDLYYTWNLDEKNFNSVCNQYYCTSAIKFGDFLIISYYIRSTSKSQTRIIDFNSHQIIKSGNFWVFSYSEKNNELILYNVGPENNPIPIVEGTMSLDNLSIYWRE